MLLVCMAALVSSAGACSRLKQLANMLAKFVTLELGYTGTLRRLLQALNMLSRVVTPENVISGATSKAKQLLNMEAALLPLKLVEPVGKVTFRKAMAL